jgi:hypothetical protein
MKLNLPNGESATHISCGFEHTVALFNKNKVENTIFAKIWGSNRKG